MNIKQAKEGKDGYNENSEKQIYVLTLNDNKVLYEKIQNQR